MQKYDYLNRLIRRQTVLLLFAATMLPKQLKRLMLSSLVALLELN